MARWNNVIQTNEEILRFKREAVLRESGRLFSRNGYHNTSLDDIARSLGVSKGTLYNYVDDKQEILFSFHNMAMEIGERVVAAAGSSEGNGATRLRTAFANYIHEVNEELGGYGVISEIGALKPLDREAVLARRDRLYRSFTKLLEQGVTDGSVRAVDPKIAVFTMMGVMQLVPNWFSPTGRLTAREVAEAMADIVMGGMAAAPADAVPARRKRRRAEPPRATGEV